MTKRLGQIVARTSLVYSTIFLRESLVFVLGFDVVLLTMMFFLYKYNYDVAYDVAYHIVVLNVKKVIIYFIFPIGLW